MLMLGCEVSGLTKFKNDKGYNEHYQHKESDGSIMHEWGDGNRAYNFFSLAPLVWTLQSPLSWPTRTYNQIPSQGGVSP